jgi:diguanylate cyclase (GGDEF)-like protein
LTAIIALNGCLLVDYMLVHDPVLERVVKRTLVVTPVALLVNYLVRKNPKRWLREGSVGLGTALLCFINLMVEGSATAATTTFGLMCVLISVLFVNVVMRIRLAYAVSSTALMLVGGLWFAYHAAGLAGSEKTIGMSLMVIGIGITQTAGYSLERQERQGYLLFQRSEMQAEELHRLSNLDKLTGLPNRRAFEEQFDKLWMEAERARTPLSAVVIDIDHFKVVNDVYGHLYGDEVLRRVAGLLPQALREQEDMAARFGGEEFVILLPDTQPDRAMLVAERVRSLVEMAGTPVPEVAGANGKMMWATVSCGVSTCVPESGLTRERLLKTADRALYQAKGLGRNRVQFRVCERESSAHTNVESISSMSSGARLLSKLGVRRESGSRAAARVS